MLFALFGAQDLDVALTSASPRARTILDEIEDPAERKAFLELYKESNPLARRSKAGEFAKRFPASWLLPQIYEAAARASFDLSDYPSGLAYARDSLRLYPENPLLLGTVAAVRANRGEVRIAQEAARTTLRYLDRFTPPANQSERSWEPVRERLRATSLKILGSAEAPPTATVRPPASAYSGSKSCQPCHPIQFEAWSQTGMARMLQKADVGTVAGDFQTGYSEGGKSAARTKKSPEGFTLELQNSKGVWSGYPISYVIGSKWQQAYATRAPSGELHVLPVQYNLLERAWINYWRMIDPPGSERSELTEFHNFREVTSYQRNCAPCHTSQPSEKTFLEPGVNCEMCHGPGAAHVQGQPQQWKFESVSNQQYVEVCAQCHAQSAIREPQGFPPRYRRRPYAEFSRKAFYRDGRFRETTFIVEAFERSACFRKGSAHCGNCHNPHGEGAQHNPTSLKFRSEPDRMCLQCHSGTYAQTGHTRHTQSEASRCVSCHMPKIMNSLLFRARTHQIDDRPDAEMTRRFGASESPNACLECHADRGLDWVAERLKSWRTVARAGSRP